MSSSFENIMEAFGTALDPEKTRVRCVYCGNEVGGFVVLNYHLCGVGPSSVTPCTKVPAEIKMFLSDEVTVEHHQLPLKRSFPSESSDEARRRQPRPAQEASPGMSFLGEMSTSLGTISNGVDAECAAFLQAPLLLLDHEERGKQKYCSPPQPSEAARGESSRAPRDTTVSESRSSESVRGRCPDQATTRMGKQVVTTSTSPAERCIGRFFFEAGIDPAMSTLPSFREMVDSIAACGGGRNVIPSCDDLKGWILGDETREVRARVEDIKRSWSQTGCSILLDSWKDQRGRSFINFLVDCPRGTVFWKSADVSTIVDSPRTLFMLLDMIIEEVGAEHVVQVISDDGSDTMEDAGQMVMCKYVHIFWTLCADHCVDLILRKLEMLPHVRRVLGRAKTITRFMYSDETAMDLMRRYMPGRDLVQTSPLKSVAAFLTLHNMVLEMENILGVFASLASAPSSSSSSSTAKAKAARAAAKRANDVQFWSAATDVLQLSDPVIAILNLISVEGCHAMGVLYEAFDQAKELIRSNVGGVKERYEQVWDLVDEVWSGHLHSPLHAVGYYFNPSFFYYNLHCDAEVASGLSYYISRVAKAGREQDLLRIQLDEYSGARGAFCQDAAIDQRDKISPDIWWSLYGKHCPQLQKFAIRVLSQRCSGNPKYKLRKYVTENFHEDKRNVMEQRRLQNMELVHNNLRLWQPHLDNEPESVYMDMDVNPLSEWIVDGSHPSV